MQLILNYFLFVFIFLQFICVNYVRVSFSIERFKMIITISIKLRFFDWNKIWRLFSTMFIVEFKVLIHFSDPMPQCIIFCNKNNYYNRT